MLEGNIQSTVKSTHTDMPTKTEILVALKIAFISPLFLSDSGITNNFSLSAFSSGVTFVSLVAITIAIILQAIPIMLGSKYGGSVTSAETV